MSGYGRSNEVWQYRDTYWQKSAWLKGFITHERRSQLDKLRVFPATWVISTWLIYAANSNPFHQKTFTQTLCTSMWKYKQTRNNTFIKIAIFCLLNTEEFFFRKYLNSHIENISLFSTTFIVGKHMQKALTFILYSRVLYGCSWIKNPHHLHAFRCEVR